MTTVHYDPFSVEVQRDPYPHYAALREHAPVYRLEGPGFYVVSRYEDVMFVLKHPELFSSRAMQMMMLSGMGMGIQSMGGAGLDPAALKLMAEMAKDLPFDPAEMMSKPSLIASDPPNHERLRNIVNRGFTPRRIAALEPRVREIARDALDKMLAKDEFDLVSEYTIPLPVRVIAELLGVEPEHQADFKRWSDEIISGSTGAASGTRPDSMIQAFREFNAYFVEAIERRRKDPKDDLISTLVAAEDGDAALSPMETLMFTILLLVAGNETTTNLIGNGTLALVRNPDQLARVQSTPALIPAMIEEALRYDSPVQVLFRQAAGDVELADTKIPKDSIVLPIFASANRDGARFPDPDRFDVTRDPRGHVAFGFGIHFCLGASLARLEARVGFEELLSRVGGLEALDSQVDYIDSFLLRGPESLRLRAEQS
jgi:cytochrome P450